LVGKKGKKGFDFSSKQVKVKKEDTEKEVKKEIKKEVKEIKEVKKEIKTENESGNEWEEIRQEEPARPSTPPASGPATQTQKRPLSLSSPQPLPRPKAPVPPETPPRQGICDNAIELSEPMSDNVGEEEEGEKEGKDQAPPAQGTMPAAKGKAKAKKRGLKK